jgi:hypothetical protein
MLAMKDFVARMLTMMFSAWRQKLTVGTGGLAFPRAAYHFLATRRRANMVLDIVVAWDIDAVLAIGEFLGYDNIALNSMWSTSHRAFIASEKLMTSVWRSPGNVFMNMSTSEL